MSNPHVSPVQVGGGYYALYIPDTPEEGVASWDTMLGLLSDGWEVVASAGDDNDDHGVYLLVPPVVVDGV